MATKTNNLVTKPYIDKKFNEFKIELKTELRSELGADLKEELYQIKDEIVGEIKALREEFDAHQYSHIRINEDLIDHENRITKLEKPHLH